MDPLTGFIQTYFIQPILDPRVPGYNPVNTITYGAILLGIAFYGIFPYLNKHGVKFDWWFMRALLPYIAFGSTLRVLEDQHILLRSANPLEAGFYVYTPGIWFLTFALVVLGIMLGKHFAPQFKREWTTLTLGFGILLAAPTILLNLTHGSEWTGAGIILALTIGISWIAFSAAQKMKWDFMNEKLAKLVFFGQMLDASATFTALQFYGCGEQHVLPRLLFGAFGNISFFFVKIPLVLGVLYYLHREYAKENENEKNFWGFILVFLAILGLATGTRDLVTVLVGTCTP